MYLGQMVELGSNERPILPPPPAPLYQGAARPPAPRVGQFGRRDRILLEGDIPSPADPPSGCRFRTRCPHAAECCAQEPKWVEAEPGHFIFCHRFQELDTAAPA